jgi:hypothetical protein
MPLTDDWNELAVHLAATTRLSEAEACKVIDEVLGFLDENVEAFVRRRHAQLRAQGERNATIYRRLLGDLQTRRFRAAPYSERQIRRLIYG